jgi:hypothetical protein
MLHFFKPLVFDVFGRVFKGQKREAVRFPFGRVNGAHGTKIAVDLSVYDGGQLAFDEAERRVFDSSGFCIDVLDEIVGEVLHDMSIVLFLP